MTTAATIPNPGSTPQPQGAKPSRTATREFVGLITALMALTALSIDLMLPVFSDIRTEFGMAADSSRVGWVITAFFIGLAGGQLAYGLASDRFGRRRPLFVGLTLYMVGAILASIAPTFGLVIAGRVVSGLGAAGTRTLTLAMLRDRFEGDRMARLMSMIMAVFILVPIVAPSLGALIAHFAPWRWVMATPALIGGLVAVWAYIRLPETLEPSRRRAFNRAEIADAARAVLGNRQTRWLMFAVMFLQSVFTLYLSSSELIIDDTFGFKSWFPLIFAVVAMFLGLSSLANARFIGRLGLIRLIRVLAVAAIAAAIVLAGVSVITSGQPNFWLFFGVLTLVLSIVQCLTPSCNTAAMAPVPHVAGTASAVIGTISLFGGSLIGAIGGALFDGTVRPIGVFIMVSVAAAGICVAMATAPGKGIDERATR